MICGVLQDLFTHLHGCYNMKVYICIIPSIEIDTALNGHSAHAPLLKIERFVYWLKYAYTRLIWNYQR